MTSPIIKARRLGGHQRSDGKKIIRCIAAAGGIPLDTKDIATTWKDGLLNDITEDTSCMNLGHGRGKASWPIHRHQAVRQLGRHGGRGRTGRHRGRACGGI